MKMKISTCIATGLLCAMVAAPAISPAQSIHHRRKTEDTWRQLTYGSAALGALGLLGHNGTVTTIGAAGTLYSAYRWQEDLKSRHRMERERAEVFSHRNVYYHGHHYRRYTTWKHGKKYFYLKRVG